jgi:hypothetical protein
MIEVTCCSAEKTSVPEAAVGKTARCPACGRVTKIVSGEPLADEAGSGDFDAALVADEGTTLPVGRYVLGGVADISIGKSPDCNIVLTGPDMRRLEVASRSGARPPFRRVRMQRYASQRMGTPSAESSSITSTVLRAFKSSS